MTSRPLITLPLSAADQTPVSIRADNWQDASFALAEALRALEERLIANTLRAWMSARTTPIPSDAPRASWTRSEVVWKDFERWAISQKLPVSSKPRGLAVLRTLLGLPRLAHVGYPIRVREP